MWPRYGIIYNRPIDSFTLGTPTTGSGLGDGVGGGGSTGGGVGNGLNNSINFSNMNVIYHKINLFATKSNIYGESLEKWYYPPLFVKCFIDRGITSNSDDEFGVNISQTITITISRDYIQKYNFIPEVGDIVMDRERYYEVNSLDSQFFTIPGTATPNGTQGTTGQSLSYVLTCYLTRITKLNLIENYQ